MKIEKDKFKIIEKFYELLPKEFSRNEHPKLKEIQSGVAYFTYDKSKPDNEKVKLYSPNEVIKLINELPDKWDELYRIKACSIENFNLATKDIQVKQVKNEIKNTRKIRL